MISPANTQIGVRKIDKIKKNPKIANGPISLEIFATIKAPPIIGIINIYRRNKFQFIY